MTDMKKACQDMGRAFAKCLDVQRYFSIFVIGSDLLVVSVHHTLGNSSVQAGTREGRRLRVDRKIAGHAMPHF